MSKEIPFEKSFASHRKSKYWSNKNELKSNEVKLNSHKEYLFNCNCGHEIKKRISDVSKISKGSWCGYCSNPPKKLCINENCNKCFEKSFASHEKAIFWSSKNNIKSRDVFLNSNSKFIFNCINKNHEFDISLAAINNGGNWCRFCVNKTEQKLFEKLVLIYPELIQQYKVEWCKNINYLPFDFCIEEYKIIIELDGLQHFEQVSNWNSPEDNQQRDKFKMKCANDNNYSIIRILQEDVFYDTFDYINEIKQAIQKIIDDKNIQNIFICKNNEYDIFQ